MELFTKHISLIFFIAGMLVSAPVLADKPSWAGGGKGERRELEDRQDGRSRHDGGRHDERGSHDMERHEHFNDQHRLVIREYYAEELFRTGHCPPGLSRKHNGCMPPGRARKWKIGHPLPHGMVYYDLPPPVIARIGPPPVGHRYVRVNNDILLIAIGTGMIVDAIEDLNRR